MLITNLVLRARDCVFSDRQRDVGMNADEVLGQINAEAERIMRSDPAVQAILLAGSYAHGTPWPGSDVDLLVIRETGTLQQVATDLDWTTLDVISATLDALEDQMAGSFITCNSCLDLVPLIGDPSIAQQIMRTAKRLYAQHIPSGPALAYQRDQVRAGVHRLRIAQGQQDVIGQAEEGSGVVWLAGRLCLSLAGIGPIREDRWHEVFRTSSFPVDAATPYARWHLGTGLEDRLDAAVLLAEQVLGESLAPTPIVPEQAPSRPTVVRRPRPEAEEAVEMHRLIAAVGFGKMAKAEWLHDEVRQASEASVICWFGVPALLALGGIDSAALMSQGSAEPPQRWWHEALQHASLPFDAAALYAQALVSISFVERKEAALTLGRGALRELEVIFRDTSSAQKYHRPTDQA
jgi:predicted nucleotidyltransferase